MLNALGLDASAVGNHEFDQGWADLATDVIGPDGARNAQWDYLGANVYAKGTTDPVLPEYAMFEVDGVDVGVIGAVTEETGSLVSPGGIADIEFGDPVEAVNRVAAELSDGDPANGEADVIVASFHAGASQGTGRRTTRAEIAKGGEFAEMANLDPAVDVIFNGHTHQVYAWDAPVPGEPGKTRPIVQTGQYGANVGQVKLTVDPATGECPPTPRATWRGSATRRQRPGGELPARRRGQADRRRRPGQRGRVGNVSRSARSPATSPGPSRRALRRRQVGLDPRARNEDRGASRRWATSSPTRCATVCRPTSASPTSASSTRAACGPT